MRLAQAKAVFFDIDDTLYDFRTSVRLTLAHLRERFPELASDTLEDVEARYWRANVSLSESTKLALIEKDPFLYGRATWESFLREGAPRSGAPDDLASRLAVAFGDWRFANLDRAAYPRALDTVRDLAESGRRVGIISNGPSALQRAKFRALKIDKLVPEAHVVISGEFGEAKPSPRIFEAAAARAGVRPDEAVFVGDSVECDVASKRVGMSFVWFDAAKRKRPDFTAVCGFEPDATAHDYESVRRLIGLSS